MKSKLKDEKINVEDILRKTQALLTLDEGHLLFSLAKKVDKGGIIVEIGSMRGGSTILLALGSRLVDGGKVYAIDHHYPVKVQDDFGEREVSSLPLFKENIKEAEVDDLVVPIIKPSHKAEKKWRLPVKLLWVDGGHTYEFVKMDFLLWEKYLVPGGIIAFHDSHKTDKKIFSNQEIHSYHEGSAKAVRESILNSKRFKDMKVVDSITYARKVRDVYFFEALKNIFDLNVCKLRVILKKILKV